MLWAGRRGVNEECDEFSTVLGIPQGVIDSKIL